MQAQSAGSAFVCAPERSRTLVASGAAVWIWPGIPLTMPRGVDIEPVADATIRFWTSRLHGPEVLHRDIPRAVAIAARRLMAEDEIAAQRVLDALGLIDFSQDGAQLCRAVAANLGLRVPNLPVRATLQTWSVQDVALNLSIFKVHADAARALAKGVIPFDPVKHPHWGAGAPDSEGGQFRPTGASNAAIVPVALRPKRPKRLPPIGLGEHLSEPNRGIGDNSDKFPELNVPQEEPPLEDRYAVVTEIAQVLQEALAAGAQLWVRNAILGFEVIWWLRQRRTDYYHQILANLDPPKTLQELRDAVKRPTLGYHIHHIVEWEAGLENGFTEDQLESPDNLVEIPEMKHRQITNWYNAENPDYGGRSPREFLRKKSWAEHYKLGIQKLIDFGVLKP